MHRALLILWPVVNSSARFQAEVALQCPLVKPPLGVCWPSP